MKLLAVDTSTKVAGAALMQDGRLVCEMNLVSGLTHSERLMPLVDACLKSAGWLPQDIDVFAAVAGPGSFTGIRIGVAAVKGMAEANGKPVAAVGTLEVLAASFPGFAGLVAPLLDARREQVYCALYDGGLNVIAPPCARALADLLNEPDVAAAPQVMFAGDGALANRAAIQAAMGARAMFAPPHLMLQRAGAAAWLAWRKAEAGQVMDAAALLPEYLRKPQAEQIREQKLAREAGHAD